MGENGIEIITTNAYYDNSLYRDPKDITLGSDEEKICAINKNFGMNIFDEITESLDKYLTVFINAVEYTQYARVILTDKEVKECTDALFSNLTFHALNLETEAGKDKFYDLLYREFEKRDQTMEIPFSIDDPYWEPKDVKRDMLARILKPVEFTVESANKLFGHWYKGEVGKEIMMSRQHFIYFQHQGKVELANSTMSGEKIPKAQLEYDGLILSENDKLLELVQAKGSQFALALDKEERHQLFYKHENNMYSYYKPLIEVGDKVILSSAPEQEITVKQVGSKEGQTIILYAYQDKPHFSYLKEINEINHSK
ncbi:hypothetical protein QTG56_24565 (plasmid) [Rossellomorea sp. AcN35-11]|nr:hypothetical protein QTG56_24565 [Rossellomorea sp. AcN35-11]